MPAADDFAERYMITSLHSRVYTRAMLLSAAMRGVLAKTLKVSRANVGAVLDDDSWMQPRRGEIPARVTEAAVLEAFSRNQST